MRTTFYNAINCCGFTQQQAADYLGASLAAVQSWCSGRRNPPEDVYVHLAELYKRIEDAADFAAGEIAIGGIKPSQWHNIHADNGDSALPDGADGAAGAMALLLALGDDDPV